MLSSVLSSSKATEINIQIMRTFVKMRHYVLSKNDKDDQIAELRKLLMLHIENTDLKLSGHDESIKHIITALNNLLEKPKETRILGFHKGSAQ